VTCHSGPLEHSGRCGAGTDRTRGPVLLVGAVRGSLAFEVVALHPASEPLALAHGRDVESQLDEAHARLYAGFRVVTGIRLVELARGAYAVGDLKGGVALLLRGLHTHHSKSRDFDHGHGYDALRFVPDLRHADLFADDRLGGHALFASARDRAGARGQNGWRHPLSPFAPDRLWMTVPCRADAPPGHPERSAHHVSPKGPPEPALGRSRTSCSWTRRTTCPPSSKA